MVFCGVFVVLFCITAIIMSEGSDTNNNVSDELSDELKKLMKFTEEELIDYFKKQPVSYRPPHPLPRPGYWDENAQPFGGEIPQHCDPRTRPYWLWTIYIEG